MTTIVYSLKDIENIVYDNKFTLSPEVLELIDSISNQVSSPSYVKTPNFSHSDRAYKKKNKHADNIKSEDWDTIRSFQKTDMVKKEGIDKEIDNIRLLVNKLTDKTYNVIVEKIYTTLDELCSDGKYDTTCIDKIGYAIFNLASSNKFNSNTYAKLCSELNNKYDFMVPIINNHISEFMKKFDNMVFVNSNDDYNKFCDMNIENDKRRALSLFITSLEKYKVVTHEFVFDNICKIQSKIMDTKDDESKKTENDELIENLFILITNVTFPTTSNKWNVINQHIIDIGTNKYSGITNKCKFKHMDIIDFIKKTT
jgi:hypothetical protein